MLGDARRLATTDAGDCRRYPFRVPGRTSRGGEMADQLIDKPAEDVRESVDELGPVDWLVVEFPGSRFTGEIAPILDDLVDSGTIRVLDLVLIKKERGRFPGLLRAQRPRRERDRWAAVLRDRTRDAAQRGRRDGGRGSRRAGQHSGPAGLGEPLGRSVRARRYATPAASWWPPAAFRSRPSRLRSRPLRERRTDMPLARRRMRRAGVVGPAPVARTAATVGTVAVVAHGVNRRSDRREDRRDDRRDRR